MKARVSGKNEEAKRAAEFNEPTRQTPRHGVHKHAHELAPARAARV
eukprot:CAMPEP_0119361988 /NCGR_PEP_ID=MMETSP1334-20130426/9181_1 /TAXON_ID=127549 /ORGANISM="Calcidiscus leptoporus, Strain RCC1130" /LENGTH=45 /DNA_ID= /DNA_START= /DNA_END= /DNA_ORIENTATION=